ncbi:MAG: hypothetical protein QXS19_07800 [Candidatus Methanomethylicia archaeon]
MIGLRIATNEQDGFKVISSFDINQNHLRYSDRKFSSEALFYELYKDGVFSGIDLKELLVDYFNRSRSLSSVEKLVLYYVFKSLDWGEIRKEIYSKISSKMKDISNRVDSVINNMEKDLSLLLGEDIDYGVNIGEELYDSLPKNSFPKIFDDEGYVKPEFRKPRYDNKFNIDDYYKKGRNGQLYYPYPFRTGPNNPDVNHNLGVGDENVAESFNIMRDFIMVISTLDVNEVVDIVFSKIKKVKGFNLSDMIDFVVSEYKNTKSLYCDSRFLSGLDIFPVFIYGNNSTTLSIMGGFISKNGKNKKNDEDIFDVSGISLLSINVDAACIFSEESYEYQYNVFKKHLCTDSFYSLYDRIADYVYDKYLKNYNKYSTLHNVVTANIFTLLVCGDTDVFGDYRYLLMDVIYADYEQKSDDSGSVFITRLDLSISKNVKFSGNIHSKLDVSDRSPIVFVFTDVNGFEVSMDDKFIGIPTYKGQSVNESSIFNPIDIIG